MHSDLASLINLQSIDARINELAKQRENFPSSISQFEGAIKKTQDVVDGLTKKLAALLKEKKTLEETIANAKAHLDKSQDLLNAIKTNREYDAVHTQIENFKTIVSSGDAKIKKFDLDAGELQQSIEKAQAELEKTSNENNVKIAEIKGKMDVIGASIAKITEERDAIIGSVPKALLRTYNYILKGRKSGQVLSYINADDRTCSVCYKILEAQLINEIRKSDKVIVCQNCGSIFVWKDDPKIEP
jgi:uncharacterized protein